jgi:hypothetical protein
LRRIGHRHKNAGTLSNDGIDGMAAHAALLCSEADRLRFVSNEEAL